jgi:hypothetical protein
VWWLTRLSTLSPVTGLLLSLLLYAGLYALICWVSTRWNDVAPPLSPQTPPVVARVAE